MFLANDLISSSFKLYNLNDNVIISFSKNNVNTLINNIIESLETSRANIYLLIVIMNYTAKTD